MPTPFLAGAARDLPDLDALVARADAPPSPLQLEARALARRFDPTVIQAGSAGLYGGRKALHAYRDGFMEAALAARDRMRGEVSLMDVLLDLAIARGVLAREANAPDTERFGMLRGSASLSTAVVGYLQVPGVRDFFAQMSSGEALRQAPDNLVPTATGPRVVHLLDGVRVGLTQYESFGRRHAFSHYGAYLGTAMALMTPTARHRWIHAVDAPHGHVEAHLEALFQAARAPLRAELPEARRAELCGKVGALHWWLSHMCLFERGSAAITDMLSTALFELHGLHRGRWKQEIMADVVALITPRLGDFANQYEGLLRAP